MHAIEDVIWDFRWCDFVSEDAEWQTVLNTFEKSNPMTVTFVGY